MFNIPSDARPTDIGVTDGLECAVAFDGVDFWGPFKNFDAANYWLRTTRGHGWEEPEPTVSAYFIGSQKPSQFWRARMKRRWRTVAKIIQRIRRCYRKRSIGTPMGDIKMHFH